MCRRPADRYAGIEDCYTTLLWAFQNAAALRVGTEYVIVGGTSSGGTLAACVAIMARDRGFNRIMYQLLIEPAVFVHARTASIREFDAVPGWSGKNAILMWNYYLGNHIENPTGYMALGHAQSLKELPPAYVVTVELDPVHDEGLILAQNLKDSMVPVISKDYSGVPVFFPQLRRQLFLNALQKI